MRALTLLLSSLFVLSACVPQVVITPTSIPPSATATLPPTATASSTPTPPPSLTPPPTVISPTLPPPVIATTPASGSVSLTATPGLVLQGRVTLQDGTGQANVTICRSYAAYNGEVVATTDANGVFQSDFAFIPGDEMVSVWALAAGYTFDPPDYFWRHYYGVEDKTVNFVASPSAATAVPRV